MSADYRSIWLKIFEQKQAVTIEARGKLAQTTSMNVIQSVALSKPYMIPVKINAIGKCGNINTYVIDAIIDSWSSISIICDSIVKDETSPINEDVSHTILWNKQFATQSIKYFLWRGDLEGVRTKIMFYTVADDTMAYKVLLSRNFFILSIIARYTRKCHRNWKCGRSKY